jgi:DNA-binding GntR family transcriptional regulator
MAFHEKLYEIAGNLVLREMFAGVREKFVIARREVYFKVNKKETLVDELHEHKTIVDLIKAGDGDRAAEEMRNHLQKPLQRLRAIRAQSGD